jgi:hypothetical protein
VDIRVGHGGDTMDVDNDDMGFDNDDMDVDNEDKGSEPTRHEIPEFQPPPTAYGRQRRFPRRYQDFLPNSTVHIPHMPPTPAIAKPTVAAPSRSPSPVIEIPEPTPTSILKTDRDEFGVYRVYTTYPSTNPDEIQDLESRCDAPGLATASEGREKRWWTSFGQAEPGLSSLKGPANFCAPFLNATVFRLMNWFYSATSTKSVAELQSLVDDVLLAPDFDVSDLRGFNARRELRRLDDEPERHSGMSSLLADQNGWRQSTVKIKLPAEKVCQIEDDANTLEIPGVYHRSLIEVITTAIQDNNAKTFHYTPFSLYWQPTPESTPERLYSEIYNSDEFIEEHSRIRQLPPEPGPQYEHAIAAMMISSDSTNLGQFGCASLWPIYAFFGNQSKYDRAKPSQFAAHHVAYIPSVCPMFSAFPIVD